MNDPGLTGDQSGLTGDWKTGDWDQSSLTGDRKTGDRKIYLYAPFHRGMNDLTPQLHEHEAHGGRIVSGSGRESVVLWMHDHTYPYETDFLKKSSSEKRPVQAKECVLGCLPHDEAQSAL